MKDKFLSKAYGGVTVARRKLYGLGLPRQWKVITSTLLLLFTFAIGNVWGATGDATTSNAPKSGGTSKDYANTISVAAGYLDGNVMYYISNNLTFISTDGLEANYLGFVFKPSVDLTIDFEGFNGNSGDVNITYQIDSIADAAFYEVFTEAGSNKISEKIISDNGGESASSTHTVLNYWKDNGVVKYSSKKWQSNGDNAPKNLAGQQNTTYFGNTRLVTDKVVAISSTKSAAAGTYSFMRDATNKFVFKAGKVYRIYSTRGSSKTGYKSFTFTPVYQLTWALDGGSITSAADAYTNAGYYAAGTALTAPTVEKSGFDFSGWSPTVAATMPAAATTYTATWSAADTYDATFANGGHGMAPSKAEGVSSVTLAEITGVAGWKNTGWTADVATKVGTTDKAAGAHLDNGATVTLLENTTFTAEWAQLYTVTYNKAGGEGGDVPTQDALQNGETFDVAGQGTLTAPTAGYIFRGWSDGIASDPYEEGDDYTINSANVSFTAVWEAPVTYTVALDANGGTIASYDGWDIEGNVYSKTVTEGTEVSLLAFTKSGSQLMFFRDGDDNEYSSSVTLNSNLNLKAIWGEEKEVELYYWEGKEGGAIERGGTAVSVDKDGNPTAGNADVNASVSTYYTIRVQGKYDYSNPYVKITTDESVKTGDKITFTGFINKNQEKDAAMLMKAGDKVLFAETTSLPNIAYPVETPETPEEREYTISTTNVDATVLDLMRNNGHSGTNCFVTKLAITGTRVVEVKDPCKTPTITTQPVGGTYNWNADPSMSVTASAPDGGTLKYQWYKKGTPDAKVGTNSDAFTPTESGTYYVIVTNTKVGYGDADLKSDEVAVTINARPSYKVTYYDGSTNKLGEEDVLEAANPADYADYQAKALYGINGLYEFNGWYSNSDLAEGHKIANIATLAISGVTDIYGKWTKKYAENVNLVEYATTIAGDESTEAELTDFKTWFTGKGYVYANLKALDNKAGNNGAYLGLKTKSNEAYYAFNVVANKRVTIKLGYMAGAAEMYINGVKNTTQALTGGSISSGDNYADWYYDVTEESTLQLKIVNGGTCVLKAVTIGEIPAVSDDATLSDLTLKYGEEEATTITGFVSSKYIYNVVMPYGTTKAELPIVGATATQGAKSLVTINQAKDRDDWKTVIRVQAEDRVDEHDKYYEVRFIVEPKQGISLIKATTQKVVTGYIGGTAVLTKDGSAQSGNTYKLDSKVTFGITLADGKKFKEGDVFVMNITTAPGSATSMGTMKVYDAADATEPIYETAEVGSVGVNYWTLPAAAEGKTSLYIKRGDGKDWNPTFSYVEVQRLMAPVIKSFKIGEEVGAINESAKTIAVEVPYGTAVNALTPEIEYYGNGIGAIDKTGPQDFTNPVEYTVSSAYAEDATGDYAPVTYTVTVNVADHYEAKIGDVGYATLVEAVAAAVDGDVIVLQENVTAGAGVMIAKADAKQITIDFGGFTYKAVSPGVGSVGTQNQAFHFEKGCDITLKNGTITSEGNAILMLVQNYGDLTLENITLDGSGLEGSHRYVMSNNCGDVVIGDGATITAKTGDVAFDVCATNYYPEGVTVTVKDGATISGIVEYDVWGTKPADNKAELAIEGGTLNITWNVESALAEDAKANLNVSGGVFNAAVPEDYCAEGYAPYQIAEGQYGVQYEGVIRAAATQMEAHGNAYAVTLDNGIVVISSNSDGKFDSSNQFDDEAADAAVALGADEGKYRYKGQHILLTFPKNVKEFTIYSYDNNTTDRKINKVTFGGDPSVDKLKNFDEVGTYTFTNNTTTKLRTMTATMGDDEIIPAGEYVYIGMSNAHTVFRILFTEAECTDPVINSTNAIRAKVGEEATVSVDASAIGASYTWYRCDDELGTNPQPITGATKASYKFTKAAGNEYFKVVVGCNCSVKTAEAIITAEEWYQVDRVNVTGYTEWNWAGVYDDATAGPQINQAQKGLVLASYIDAPNFNKLEGNNNAYVYRKNQYPAYQGTSLKFTTEIPGMLIIDASYQDSGNEITVNGNNLGALPKNHAADFKIAVPAGDVTITSAGMRIWAMKFDPDFSNYAITANHFNGYTRPVTEGRYGTICLPNGGIMVGAEIFELAFYGETSHKFFFDEIASGVMEAGKPYLFLPKEGVDKLGVFYTDNANEAAKTVNGLVGYIGADAEDYMQVPDNGNCYIIQNNLYRQVQSGGVAYILSNRAYIDMSGATNVEPAKAPGVRRIGLGVQGEQVATGIENTGFESETPRKVLINGELFIIRGEKMYDAKGQLVK